MLSDDFLSNDSGAVFSNCFNYRYALWRFWDRKLPYAMFIGLNPSTADATKDDPTIRRCINFSKDWGYGGLVMANLFALRATKPKDMLSHNLPQKGMLNDDYLIELSKNAGIVIAAWGTNGEYKHRDEFVLNMIPGMKHLGLTKHGKPRHPLYLKSNTKPQSFN